MFTNIIQICTERGKQEICIEKNIFVARTNALLVGVLISTGDLACIAGSIARDGSAIKSHSTILQRLCRQISLDYYTIPPATQATGDLSV